jgi:uncharacterized membrane protein YqiK
LTEAKEVKQKNSKLLVIVLLALIGSFLMSGCYWQASVDGSEVGLVLNNGISIDSVVGPGRYDNPFGWYAKLKIIDTSVKTVEWTDASLVTSDKQPISLKLAISYHRNSSEEVVRQMYSTYNRELFDDGALATLVASRVPNSAKNNTAKMNLDQLLFGREDFANNLNKELSKELMRVGVVLDTVQVADIGADEGYMAKLKQKAQVIQDREIAQESVKTAEQNLLKTRAESEIQIELAKRQNEVNKELAKVYEGNARFYELKRLEALEKVLGPNAKIVFIPEGSPLSVINSESGTNVVPVPQQ